MAKPFLKWAGGKTQLLNVIRENAPFEIRRYIEPFVGSGAVLFDIMNNNMVEEVIINDINRDLINVYNSIRDNCDRVVEKLCEMQNIYLNADETLRKQIFLDIRDAYNKRGGDLIEHACMFIFLNKTCFNGLYRVNSKNLFNVPHGKYKSPKILDTDNLIDVSRMLTNVEVRCGDYYDLRNDIVEGTFVYLDPPYKPISETSSFNSYYMVKFDDIEQIRLKEFCDFITERGAYFMLSNSDPSSTDANNNFFDELYRGYNIRRVQAKRFINAKGSERGEVNELLITNY